LISFAISLAAHVVEDVPANMHSHISKNVLFTTNETGDLGISLKNSGSLCWNEVADDKMLLAWRRDEIKKLH